MRTTGREVHVLQDYEGHGLVFLQGGRYVVEEPTLGHLLMMGIAGETELRNEPPRAGNRVLVTRSGGFGDLLFLTPLLRTLLAQGKEVTVCCHAKYREALSGVPVEWCPYPMFVSDVDSYDEELWMEGVIEFAEKPEVHAVDLFAEAARVELTEGKESSFAVQDADRAWAELHFPKKGKRIGVQLMASNPARSYPKEMMVDVIQRLLEPGDTEIALFGSPGTVQLEANHPLILNVAAKAERFGQSAAVLEQCEVVLAPDSAIAHLAGALRLPTIALYGPFPWQARTAYAPSVRALTGVLRCAPCYWHGRGGPYPPDGPCSITGKCEALAQIEPEWIVREVRKYL